MENKINCRLCDRDITGKNGFLLFDYNENTETKLGRKINTILNTQEKYENLSNYCCECCSSKIEICFSLLVEIKASDEVIRQTYENLSNKKEVETARQYFICQECNTTVLGIKLFIKHHKNHILKKTTAGSKKDIELSSIVAFNQKKNAAKTSSVESSEEAVFLNETCTVNSEFKKSSNFKDNFTQSKNKKENFNRELLPDFICDEDNYGNDDDANSDSLSDLNLSCDELNGSIDKSTVLEDLDSSEKLSENESNYASENVFGSFKDSEYLSEDSNCSDVQSEDSFASNSSFKNLVEVVKWELEKSDGEDSELKIEPDKDGKYSCDVCNITFEYKFILELHLKKNHTAFHEFDIALQEKQLEILESENDSCIKCCYCKKAFHTFEFKSHLLECREQYSYSRNTLCQICGKMCSFRNLEKHMDEHKKLESWKCELCGKKFKAKRFLKSHLGEHDESKKKICEICGKKLLPLSFFSHITKHREKRHVCQYCGKAFTYNYGLRIHLKVHDANKKLGSKPEKKRDKVFCWLCKKDFNCTIALNKHLKNDHNAEGVEQDSRFPCSQCEKKFADMFSLKAHLKLIHELKDEEIARLKSLPVYRYIECNICNKVFNSENKIRIHMKQDHGLKPFEMEILKKECEKCGKKFASKQNLIHHINGAHLHIKPMTCDICQEKFAKHSSLIYHKLRHSGEKPFQCEFCHKSYRQRNDVIRHLARHVRDKELTLEEASAVNNSPSRLVIKRRIFLKDSSINYRTIVRKNRRKSEVIEMEPVLEEEVNEIQEEQMEFNEDGISDMIYVEEVQVDESQLGSPLDVHCMNAKPIYNEERNTIILSNPDAVKTSVKNFSCKYIPSQLKRMPAVIVKKQEQI